MNKLFITAGVVLVWLIWILLSEPARAQGAVVSQGGPGKYGPWPVALYLADGGVYGPPSGGGTIDGGVVATTPLTCTGPSHKFTSVGITSTATPSSQLASRRFIVLCNTLQNSGVPLLKCRIDGVAPVMAATNPGDVLGVGDCITYVIAAATIPQCIADTASTGVTSIECL